MVSDTYLMFIDPLRIFESLLGSVGTFWLETKVLFGTCTTNINSHWFGIVVQ